jgi:hypothetical protein
MSINLQQEIRSLLATQDLLRTVLDSWQGNVRINEELVRELITMGSLLTTVWVEANTPIVSEMKIIARTKKVVTENPEAPELGRKRVPRETIMAMRTFVVSATLEAGKVVVEKVWEGDVNVDAARQAVAQCLRVLNINDWSCSATWHYRLLRGWDKTGEEFKEWRSQGLEYVIELEQRLIKLENEGSDPQAIISGLCEMHRVREHFAKYQWDDFKVRWNMWALAEAVDDASTTFRALQEEQTAWFKTTGASSSRSGSEETFLTELNKTVESILTQVNTAATQASNETH